MALGPTGIVEIANPAASELLGIAVERGRPLARPWPADALEQSDDGDHASFALDVETPRGRYLRVQRAALRSDDPLGPSLVVVSDRTAERDREASERRFLANASHELRTPLAAIVAAVEVLEAGAKDDLPARDAFLADLQREAHRLQRLTDRLLTLARMGSSTLDPVLQPVQLRTRLAHVADLMQPLAEAGGVTLEVEGECLAFADPDILDQVMVGLVGNALKHTPEDGTIRLSAIEHEDGRCVTIADSGHGIPADEVPRVFDRFWRGDGARRAGGFGLGLGICREYVEAMNGAIAIRSRVGHGTTVAITLPRVPMPEEIELGARALMAARILIADDEEPIVRAVTYALEREGYEVEAVFDGSQALERARTGWHDLAILDVMMPGASGLAVCRQIRAESALPIILLTARDSEVDTVVGLEAGADDYVTKPFSVAELVGRVAALLRRRRIDAEDRAPARISAGGIDIDPLSRTVTAEGNDVRLTTAEFDLLLLLAQSPGQVFTRSAIMEHLWRTPFFGDARAADTHVANIRRKIERDPARPTRILTVRGVGYKLGNPLRP